MTDLIAVYESEWRELDRLLRSAEHSIGSLSPETLARIDVLYRRATVHLARATTRGRDPQLIAYLNSLTARAHSLIYVSPRRSLLLGGWRFLSTGFARCIARQWKMHLASAIIFFGSALFGYFISQQDTQAAYALSNPQDLRQPGSSPEQLQDILRGGRDQQHGELFLFASFLFQNNLKVAIMALATGILASVPTVLILVSNGLMLGHFASLHSHSSELFWEMWAWILPHGIPELGAIVLAGGTGIMLGQALLRPGELSRAESLRRAGTEAGLTTIGLAGMLLIAAIIESYVRQSHWSTSTRLAFASVTGVAWTAYFYNGWRLERAHR
ncbi:MAG: stage II sporulation protein M [Planctomycetaceae bacterium]|nr:stage II sporulation protein M [Planctomycetaceae bacterium]